MHFNFLFFFCLNLLGAKGFLFFGFSLTLLLSCTLLNLFLCLHCLFWGLLHHFFCLAMHLCYFLFFFRIGLTLLLTVDLLFLCISLARQLIDLDLIILTLLILSFFDYFFGLTLLLKQLFNFSLNWSCFNFYLGLRVLISQVFYLLFCLTVIIKCIEHFFHFSFSLSELSCEGYKIGLSLCICQGFGKSLHWLFNCFYSLFFFRRRFLRLNSSYLFGQLLFKGSFLFGHLLYKISFLFCHLLFQFLNIFFKFLDLGF